MLYEGNVLTCIQIVDSVSIATSTNFMIHVLTDPNDGSRYTATDDFSEFQKAVINMTVLSDEIKQQMASQKIEFEDMQLEFMDVRKVAGDANSIAEEARAIAEQALQTSQSALNTIIDLTTIATEARDTAQEAKDSVAQVEVEVQELSDRLDNNEQITQAIKEVAESAKEIAEAIAEKECCCGVKPEEMEAAIGEAKQEVLDQTGTELMNALTIREFL